MRKQDSIFLQIHRQHPYHTRVLHRFPCKALCGDHWIDATSKISDLIKKKAKFVDLEFLPVQTSFLSLPRLDHGHGSCLQGLIS
ncbi:hypothetical protein EON65_19810 [archaeon]|nr:MAG: hypothetical protein EON65_19810 [archaeon]